MDLVTTLQNFGISAIVSSMISLGMKYFYDGKIESLKSLLKIQEEKFSLLHRDRIPIIKELQQKLLALRSAMHNFTTPKRGIYTDKMFDDALISIKEFGDLLSKNRIFFKKDLSDNLSDIIKSYRTAYMDYNNVPDINGERITPMEFSNYKSVKRTSAIKSIREDIPKAMEAIEDEFRGLLGVEEPK